MRNFFKYFLIFLVGATVYISLEILARGHSHWTMFLAGGTCFAVLFHIFTRKNRRFIVNCIIGATVITLIEFLFGCVFNLALGWNIWDYSHYTHHILGQVCLPFTGLWFFLSIPIIWLSRIIHGFLFTPKYP